MVTRTRQWPRRDYDNSEFSCVSKVHFLSTFPFNTRVQPSFCIMYTGEIEIIRMPYGVSTVFKNAGYVAPCVGETNSYTQSRLGQLQTKNNGVIKTTPRRYLRPRCACGFACDAHAKRSV